MSIRACAAALAASAAMSAAGAQAQAGDVHVLIFSHSTGWRHDSIETGVVALTTLLRDQGFWVEASEDPAVFSIDGLKDVDVVVLLNTTSNSKTEDGEWFVGARREAFRSFVEGGGGVVGIHGASDSHYKWPWYGQMIGGYFERHPKGTPEGVLLVVDPETVETRELPTRHARVDEWYYIQDFDPTVEVLITLDPQSIGEPDVNPNPISWRHEFDGGRVFYTSMGHTKETYADPYFLTHVAGAVRWTAGRSANR